MTIVLKSGEVYVATATRSYPNFDATFMVGEAAVVATFRNATFSTDDVYLATAIDKEVKSSGTPWLTEGKVIPVEQLDPLFALREKIRAEELAKLKEAAGTNSTSANSGSLVTSASVSESAIAAAQAKSTPAAANTIKK